MSTLAQVEELKRLTAHVNESATIAVEGVPYIYIRDVWQMAWPLLRPAVSLRPDNPNEREILIDLINRERQLWVGVDKKSREIVVAMSTRIFCHRGHNRPTFALDFVGGTRLMEWKELVNYLTMFAEFDQCGGIELCDARGGAWERVLREANFKPVYTLLRKELA